MKLKNISASPIVFGDLFKPRTNTNIQLDPGQEIIVFDEDAEQSTSLTALMLAGYVTKISSEEPSSSDPNSNTPSLDSSIVHISDTETITGSKTFTTPIISNGGLSASGLDIPFDSKNITDVGDVDGVDISTHSHTGADGTPKVLGTNIDSTGGSNGDVLTSDGSGHSSWAPAASGGHTIEDEGSPLPQRSTLNFVGSGVSVIDTGTKTEVDISGSSLLFAKDSRTVTSPISDHTIVLANTPVLHSEIVLWNGLGLKSGVSYDYTISGNTITINAGVTLTVGDELQITYPY